MSAPWQMTEILLEAGDADDDAFVRRVTVTFEGPTGTIERPAFWNGGADYRVRFAAPALGDWSYSVASDPADPILDGHRGRVRVTGRGRLPLEQHGFLRASSSGRHLEHADGHPFFWLGDTHWRFTREDWDAPTSKAGWSSWFRGVVDLRREQGFTVYQSNLLSFGDGWATSALWGGGRPFRDLDLDYVRRVLDPRFEYVAKAGLVHAVGIAWYSAVDTDVDGLQGFARYLVARYGAYPMVWTLGGEVGGYDGELREARIDGWRAVALAIRDADAYDHPRTAHLTNERPIADYFQGEDWLNFTLHQHGHGDLDMSPSHYRDHLARFPDLPIVEGESMYEGITTVEPIARRIATDTIVRQVAYRAIQSGCCGYTYGAQGVWNGAGDRRDLATMWGDLPWYEGVDLPGAAQMGYLRQFYEGLPWTDLRPAPEVFDARGYINAVFYPPAVSADAARRTVVAYFGETYRSDEGEPAFLGLPDADFDISWFDPRLGISRVAAAARRPEQGRLALPGKPDERSDWVLVARARS